MKYPELTVGAFIINKKGEMLLVRSPKWHGLYSIPGGHVEFGESIFKAVKREAYEEVGLRVKPIKLFMIQEVIKPAQFYDRKRHFIFFDVLCKPLSENVRIDNKEITDYMWCRPKEALNMRLEKYTRNLVKAYIKHGKQAKHPITLITVKKP